MKRICRRIASGAKMPMVVNHPDRPGGISHYCPTCDDHVRVVFGLVPVRLKRCHCGAFTGVNGAAKATWTCRECKATKFGEEDLIWLKGLGISEQAENDSGESKD